MNIDILNAYCGLGSSRGHAWPRVGLANYRCNFFIFIQRIWETAVYKASPLYLMMVLKNCISLKSLRFQTNRQSLSLLLIWVIRKERADAHLISTRLLVPVWLEELYRVRALMRQCLLLLSPSFCPTLKDSTFYLIARLAMCV